jgi:hypothetical protein
MPARAETGSRLACRVRAAVLALAVGAAGCAGGPTFQGRGYHGNEYSLVTRGVDPEQRTRQALREAALFCESQGLGIVPGSALQGGTTTTLTFQCTDERSQRSGAARPAGAHGE